MANNAQDIAMIGDRDSVLLAKAAGLAVFAEDDGAAATRRIHALAKGGTKVIFITEPLFEQCAEAVEQYRRESTPAIIPIPGPNGSTGAAMAQIKSNVEKAIGADILFN